jgi:hypothetical protein
MFPALLGLVSRDHEKHHRRVKHLIEARQAYLRATLELN